MLRGFAGLVALGIWTAAGLSAGVAEDRMRFEWRLDGPAEACAPDCQRWIAASGYIAADSVRDFESFARDHDVQGAILVLNSEGGSVLGAMALGRMVRERAMVTTVGRMQEPAANHGEERHSRLRPDGMCESMCAFLLLAGAQRYVPKEARVLVHQIWIGRKRSHAAEQTYTAEELDTIQRDIGRLASYTFEMGGTGDFLEAALQIPPWAPLYQLSADELRRMRLSTTDLSVAFAPRPPSSIAGAVVQTTAQNVQNVMQRTQE
jgi:hypothetical protein